MSNQIWMGGFPASAKDGTDGTFNFEFFDAFHLQAEVPRAHSSRHKAQQVCIIIYADINCRMRKGAPALLSARLFKS